MPKHFLTMFPTGDTSSDSGDSDDGAKQTDWKTAKQFKIFRTSSTNHFPASSTSKSKHPSIIDDDLFVMDFAPGSSTEGTTKFAPPRRQKMATGKKALSKQKNGSSRSVVELEDKALNELLSKSVLRPGGGQHLNDGFKTDSRRAAKRKRKAERERTKGSDWFDLPATELTDERRRDLEILQMRDVLDPKTHYKSNERTVLPKYFQVGKVVESKADFYNSRVPKKQRKKTIVDELLSDAALLRRNKKRHDEIAAKKAITRRGAFQHKSYPKKNG